MATEITAKLSLTKEELAHVYQGGLLCIKIKGKDGNASVEISCEDSPPHRGTRIRFKHITAE